MSPHAAGRTGYGAAARATGTPRSIEYQVFSQVTGQLAQALGADAPFAHLAEALHENQRLWTVLGLDLAAEENGLPKALRGQLLSLAMFTRAHTRKVLRREAEAGVLVEINTAVMRGLRGRGSPADPGMAGRAARTAPGGVPDAGPGAKPGATPVATAAGAAG